MAMEAPINREFEFLLTNGQVNNQIRLYEFINALRSKLAEVEAASSSLAIGATITDGVDNLLLFLDADGTLRQHANLSYDNLTNLFQRIHSGSGGNPHSATVESCIRNNTAIQGWLHFLSSGGAVRAAFGMMQVGGDDAAVVWADRYFRVLTGASVERLRVSGVAGILGFSAIQNLMGADLASAATQTMDPLLGSVRTITGTTNGDFLTTTNHQAGHRITMIAAGVRDINHNTGSPPINTAPFLNTSGAAVTTAAGRAYSYVYNGTAWVQD